MEAASTDGEPNGAMELTFVGGQTTPTPDRKPIRNEISALVDAGQTARTSKRIN